MNLDSYIRQARGVLFEWGHHDCLQFVSGWIELKTGNPCEACPRGVYDDEKSAAKYLLGLLTKHEVSDLPSLFDVLFTRQAEPCRGMICLLPTGAASRTQSYLAGVVNTKWTFVAVDKTGITQLPSDNAMFWSVE